MKPLVSRRRRAEHAERAAREAEHAAALDAAVEETLADPEKLAAARRAIAHQQFAQLHPSVRRHLLLGTGPLIQAAFTIDTPVAQAARQLRAALEIERGASLVVRETAQAARDRAQAMLDANL